MEKTTLDLENEIYQLIGRALTEWSKVEETLSGLFALATIQRVDDKIGPAACAFWAVLSFDAKLRMTDAALTFRLSDHEALVTEWHSLKKSLSKKAKKRAELAHGTVARWTFTNPKTKEKEAGSFFAPSLYKQVNAKSDSSLRVRVMITTSGDTRPEGRLDKEDIEERIGGFQKTKKRLQTFHGLAYRELEQRQKASDEAFAKLTATEPCTAP
jgi:hypothetical protein